MTEQLRAAREAFEEASTPAARSRAAHDLSDALAGRLLGERAFTFARDCMVSKKLSPWAESLWFELQLGELLNHTVDPARFTLRRALHGTLPEMRLHTVLRRLLAGGHGLRPHEEPWLIHGLLYSLYDDEPVAAEAEVVGLAALCRSSARRGVPTELLAITAQYTTRYPQPLALLCLCYRQVYGEGRPYPLPRPQNGALYVPDVVLARWAEVDPSTPQNGPKRRRTE